MKLQRFWHDPKVQEMNPSEKLFYLYLLTAPKATSKTYQITTDEMSRHMGFSVDTVNVLLRRFEIEYALINYSDNKITVWGL